MARSSSSPLEIYTFGEARIESDARETPRLTKPAKALLVYLALAPAQAHSRETLANLFWLAPADLGDDVQELRAQSSLRTALKNLRAAFGDDVIVEGRDEHTLQFNPARPVRLDLRAFVNAGRDYLASPRTTESPLSLLRGEFMAGYDDLPAPGWIERERERLNALEQQLLLADAGIKKQRGEYAAALANLERVLQRDPTNQDACAQAMWCYWRLNQPQNALRLYEELKRVLREQNESPLNALRQLRSKIQNDLERAARRALQLTNLPVLETSFIGRATELQELRGLLHPREGKPRRLITLVGTGGSGKTRLARELAASVLKQYRDGVWWIELDALEQDKGDVAQAMAQVLGVRHETERSLLDTLAEYLRDKKLLLVLDNCEHVLSACEMVCAKLLSHCPRVQIVATSRQVLRVTGEKRFPLKPFEIPSLRDAASPKTLAQFDAVRLFTDRAQQEQEQFALNAENAREVMQVCRRLDGLPLALELAAARLNTLTLREIVQGLDERFALLNRGKRIPARHETLRAVMDWSHDLLDTDERALFALLGVFAGRFTQQAVLAVVSENEAPSLSDDLSSSFVLRPSSLLESLVDKSLIQLEFEPDGSRRYRLLESLRAYAREKLDEEGERADAAYVRMARYYLDFAKTHQQDFVGLEREWDNLSYGLSIMHWQENWQEVLDYGYALTDAAFARGLYTQARAMYPQVMEAAGRLEEQGADIQMRLNYARAMIEQGFYPEAREVLEQLLRISEAARDEYGVAWSKLLLGRVALETNDLVIAEQFILESKALLEDLGDYKGRVEALSDLAYQQFRHTHYDKAMTLAKEALKLVQGSNDAAPHVTLYRLLADCAYMQGDMVAAEQYCQQALEWCQGDRFRGERASTMYLVSQILWRRGLFPAAQAQAELALADFRAFGDRKAEAYTLNLLILIYADVGEHAKALQAAEQSEKLLVILGDEWSVLYVWRDHGRVYRTLGKTQRARRIWEKALERIEADIPTHPLKERFLELIAEL